MIITAFKENIERSYVKLATGSGKTIIFVSLVEKLLETYPNFRCVFIVPKNVLIQQTVDKFKDQSIIGIYNAELKQKNLDKPITIASIQSLINAKNLPEINLLVFDECHRAKRQHFLLYRRYKMIRPQMKLLGLTATDYDIKKDIWQKKIVDIGLKELTNKGFLVPIVAKDGKGKIDLDGVKISKGDYVIRDLEDRFTDEKIDEQIKDMFSKTESRNKVLILATSIDHCERIKDKIENCFIVHSKMKMDDRNINIEEFKSKGKYLASVLAISEGFDYPEADCLVMMRPTRSATLYEQAVGRIARIHDSKENGLFLDYGQIIENLGFVYNISPIKEAKVNPKICSSCDSFNSPDAKRCCDCDELFYSLCQVCLEAKPYGTKCCESNKNIDRLKKLTTKSYEEKDNWVTITEVKANPYKSKKGNICLKVDYYSGFVNMISKYYTENTYYYKKFLKEHTNYDEFIGVEDFQTTYLKAPKRITIHIKDGHKDIKAMEF